MSDINLTKEEKAYYLSQEPLLKHMFQHLQALKKLAHSDKTVIAAIETAIAYARKFNDKVIRPVYKQIDLEVARNPDYLAWDFVQKASEWGLYTLFIPKMCGGTGLNTVAINPFLEELASVCPGLALTVGAHYLGWGALVTCWNFPLTVKMSRMIKEEEQKGNPMLFCAAMTETDKGTDTEEMDLLEKGKPAITVARKVNGGYILNGQKIFITNGHYCTWHMVCAFTDRNKPVGSLVGAMVHKDWKGFSHGRIERKMGQKSGIASELILEDVFVPDEYIAVNLENFPETSTRSRRLLQQMMVDYIISTARFNVAAFAIGLARGAYDTALEYARSKKVNGTPLIQYQWAQMLLADMYKNINIARQTVSEANYAAQLYGISSIMHTPLIAFMEKYVPETVWKLWTPFMTLKLTSWILRKWTYYWHPIDNFQTQTVNSSIAKLTASDIGVLNSQLAMELMGIDGCRHDIGAEKYLRDAKLVNIYEGTNQLQKLNIGNYRIFRNMDEVRVFE
ncbi:MAG TPA: acyl-CoA dehydrogenase family protein [Deltaproteobacteria bacterium]|nr:acyl-CoA dehydrogenase family protein [Deltaproteobacteria bacterium]